MSCKPLPILHVDGSLKEYMDSQGVLHKVAGIGGYLVVGGKIVDKFHKSLENNPHLNYHENHAIIEGLKWVKSKGYSTVSIRSDSMPSVLLFSGQKKGVSKDDKFFLAQFFSLELAFDWVEIQYHNRDENDLAHNLSRTYMKNIDKSFKEIHQKKLMDKLDYERQDAALCSPIKLKIALNNSLKEINQFLL